MKAASQEIHPVVTISNGKLVTDSLNIAKVFKRKHYNVLRDIQNLDIPREFFELNFEGNEFTDAIGRKLPKYSMTRDGLTLVVMGYTGKEAMQFKIAYIKAFNLMEEELRSQARALPAPENVLDMQGRALQAGFDRGVRFTLELRRALDEFDLDEETVQTLCWYRTIGLTQQEATTLCIMARSQCERLEALLRRFGGKLPPVHMMTRKSQIRETWAEIVAAVGKESLPGTTAVARREVSHV